MKENQSGCTDVQMILGDFERPQNVVKEQESAKREFNSIYKQLRVFVCSLKRSGAWESR